MKPDPGSLDNLKDIVLPPAVPWWPPAPIWFVLFGLALLAVALLILRIVRRHRADAYRRAGVAELDGARPADLPAILKRVALAAWPREEVAPLSGSAWLRFLDRTGKTTSFTKGAGRILPRLAYAPETVGKKEFDALYTVCRDWIRRHRAAGKGAA